METPSEKISYLRKIEDSELHVVLAVLKINKTGMEEKTQSHYLTESLNLTSDLLSSNLFQTKYLAEEFIKDISINYELIIAPVNYFIDFEIKKILKSQNDG